MRRYLVIGGTGSLGTELIRQLLEKPGTEKVTCFSRCELKQKETGALFQSNPKLHFRLGDIRDRDSLRRVMPGHDTVFHVAALKHIDSLEANPEECVKTNILGTINVADAAEDAGVRLVVFSSTDKAVDPVNTYGMCKGVSERILFSRNRPNAQTNYSVYRWGNVLGSRGSAIHLFAKSLLGEGVARITDPEMSRFWIRIEDACQFILGTYETATTAKPMIPTNSMKAAPVTQVISVIAEILGVHDYKLITIGKRPGEKIHEALLSNHDDVSLDSSDALQYTRSELRSMIRPILMPGIQEKKVVIRKRMNSHQEAVAQA